MDKEESLTTRIWLEKHGPRSSEPASHYSCLKFRLDSSLIKTINQFKKTQRISENLLLMSAFGLLLNRYSSSDSSTFGLGKLATIRSGKIKVSGKLLPIQSIIDSKTSLKKHLKQMATQPNKKNAAVVHPEEMRYLLLESDKKSTRDAILLENSIHPLVIVLNPKSLSVISFYYTPIFNKHHIQQLFDHLTLIIKEICSKPAQSATQFNILTPEEKNKILERWCRHQPPSDNIIRPVCVHELFKLAVQQFPDLTAVNHNDINISYAELDKFSSYIARKLLAQNLQPGSHICVLMERTPTLIAVMLGVFKMGGVYIPINPKYPTERIEYILNDSQPAYVIANDSQLLPENFRQQTEYVSVAWPDSSTIDVPASFTLPKIDSDQTAYIIYTSGTTGAPKGVMIRHKSLANLTPWYQKYFNMTHIDRASQFASQAFDTFLCECVPYLTCGASVHIVDDNIKLTPHLFFDWLDKHRITILDLSTSYAFVLFSLPWPKNLALHTVKIGGESVTKYPHQKFSFDIWNGYGPTETTVEATFMKMYEAGSEPQMSNKLSTPPIGKPIQNGEIYVVDKYGQPVPIGVAGELLIGGPIESQGYWHRPDLTAEKFIPNTFREGSTEKLYRTGDLVHWLPDGNLGFIGRVDNQVKIRGYRIELGEIENVISKHPDVSEAVVIAKENLSGEKSLIAYIVPDLDKERYLYQERCLIAYHNKYIEAVTEDISKHGVALSGIVEPLSIGQEVQVHLKLPGFNDSKLLNCEIIWQQEHRCGLAFRLNTDDQTMVSKSIDYFLSIHNVMELVLGASAKRSLRRALKKKIPDYMVPSVFVTLMQLPLTFSGKIDTKALPPPQEFETILRKEFVLARTETEKKLSVIWAAILGTNCNALSMTDNFFDLGGSSLSAAELSVKILSDFKTSIPTKLLFDLAYIPILAEYIDTKGKKYTRQSVIQDEIARDSKLNEDIVPVKKLSKHLEDPQHILLTGAGGFLGIYLLRDLLKLTNAKIYCLIRSGEFESAAKRLNSTIQKFNLSSSLSLAERRIVAIASDISFNNFGLPLEQYNNLLAKIDCIYHCGAQVNIMAAYNKLRGSNVLGTLEIIKFATRLQDKPIHYVSTLSAVCTDPRTGTLTETFPNDNYDELFGGYAISKWVSERLLTQLKDRGLPTVLYRSGYIAGQSDNGITSLNDALFMLVKGCIQMEFAPDMQEKITILPVDFVSESICRLSLAKPDVATVYHIDHPTGIMWADLVAWLNDYGYKIKLIPMKEWQQKLLKIPPTNALYPFLPYYLALPPEFHSPVTEVDRTSKMLKSVGLDYPAIDDRLLNLYFDFLCQVDFLPRPAHKHKITSAIEQDDKFN